MSQKDPRELTRRVKKGDKDKPLLYRLSQDALHTDDRRRPEKKEEVD